MVSMNMLIKSIVFLILFSNITYAESKVDPRLIEIMRIAMNGNGYLTKDMHEQFWTLTSDHAQPNTLSTYLRNNILVFHEYSREVWESSRLSYINKTLMRTNRLGYLKSKVDKLLKKESQSSAFYKRVKYTLDNTDRLLLASSLRKTAISIEGKKVSLSLLKLIKQVSDFDKSISRISKLLNPNWE
jgi:hypothetical protein